LRAEDFILDSSQDKGNVAGWVRKRTLIKGVLYGHCWSGGELGEAWKKLMQ
jgi:hypothetical protein